jgi:triacylglycerol esterase/lipase EstA (alpha/beta hydrolase family)
LSAQANCSDPKSDLAALIRTGPDSSGKTPLILIHGKGGTPGNGDSRKDNLAWNEFRAAFLKIDPAVSGRYAIYLFQYCSDRESVSSIAVKLRDLVDARLSDRDHVIVAHSMGGLIAKSYMAETQHISGRWKGKMSGESVIGLVTLATPHHGTPGANDPSTMAKFVPDRYEVIYSALQNIYWQRKREKDDLAVAPPTTPNRADLRWDNYDKKLDPSSDDINTVLASTNSAFAPYQPKLIAYSGMASARLSTFEIAALLIETKLVDDRALRQHRVLTLANIGLVNGLGGHFGDADGLVPVASALFCRPESERNIQRPDTYVCESDSRVRRFETGGSGREIPPSQLPDKNTLSIYRSESGFDHLDMLNNPIVLEYVTRDLGTMLPAGPSKTLPTRSRQ